MNSRELTISITAGGIALFMLWYAIGFYGVISFFTFTLVSMIANSFFFLPLVNIAVKGYKNVNHEQTFVLVAIGFIFEVVYILTAHKTAYGFMIDTLKSLVVLFVISSIIIYIKREVKEI